jgi:hypothetical protein
MGFLGEAVPNRRRELERLGPWRIKKEPDKPAAFEDVQSWKAAEKVSALPQSDLSG